MSRPLIVRTCILGNAAGKLLAAIALALCISATAHSHQVPMDGKYGEIIKEKMARDESTGSSKYDSLTVLALEGLVAETPNDWRPLHILAWVYATYDEYADDKVLHKRALEYALRAQRGNPMDTSMYEILARAYMRNNMFADARAAIDQGLEVAKTEEEKNALLILIRPIGILELFHRHFGNDDQPQGTWRLRVH